MTSKWSRRRRESQECSTETTLTMRVKRELTAPRLLEVMSEVTLEAEEAAQKEAEEEGFSRTQPRERSESGK